METEKLGFMTLYQPEKLIIALRVKAAEQNLSRNQLVGIILRDFLQKLETEGGNGDGKHSRQNRQIID